jgi:precorrin-2 methylase
MGNIGQEHLTIKQINTLGKIDIVLIQFSNPFRGCMIQLKDLH